MQFDKMSAQTKYMLLGRMVSDCYSWESHGGKLWGIDPETHASAMVSIYSELKNKPEWMPVKKLRKLVFTLTKSEKLTKDL